MVEKNTNIKEGGNDGNAKVADPDVETVDLNVYVAPQGFSSESYEEYVIPNFLICQHFQK